MKLSKRFNDHANRPFDCSLDVGCQRTMTTQYVTDLPGTVIVVTVTSPTSAHLTSRNVVCRHKHNGIVIMTPIPLTLLVLEFMKCHLTCTQMYVSSENDILAVATAWIPFYHCHI